MAQKNYHTPTLEERYGNFDNFLNATADEHGGLTSDTLKKYWNWGKKPNLSVAGLAFMAGVSWQTMDDWIDRLHKEADIERIRPNRSY